MFFARCIGYIQCKVLVKVRLDEAKGENGLPDILKVTTPLINKNQPVSPKLAPELANPFNIQETTKVIQPHNQSELYGQNNGLMEEGDAPALLLNLLKDPAVTASYLKNIFLLEEIFKLLPANNKTVTQEIQQMFQSLVMDSGEIAPEMIRQEQESTLFKGELFDLLRQLSAQYQGKGEVQLAIANLLKAINNQVSKNDLLDAVANNLAFLRRGLSTSQDLAGRLDALIQGFRGENAQGNFSLLKAETLALFRDIEDSVLFTPKLGKVLSILTHNLSRYNGNDEFLGESVYRLRQMLAGPQRQEFMQKMERFLNALRSGDLDSLRNPAPQEPAVPPQEAPPMTAEEKLASLAAQTEEKAAALAEGEELVPEEPVKPEGPKQPALSPEELAKATRREALERASGEPSKVMESLTKLVAKQSGTEDLNPAEAAKVEKILYSLLSSPCNFTPLLHFIVPAFQDGTRAFAEIWINPDSDEKDMPAGAGRGQHFLLVIDVDGVGRFEAELFVYKKTIDFALFCPPGYAESFEDMMRRLPRLMVDTEYRLGQTRLETLDHSRSLMEVFKSLPYKRVGMDVKI